MPTTTPCQTVSAPIKTFSLNGHARAYIDISIPFGEYRKFFRSNVFNALKGEGEQRQQDPNWTKKLTKVLLEGNYTPSNHAACLKTKQRKDRLSVKDGIATLELLESDPIPSTDGQHRDAALAAVLANLPDLKAEVDALPIDVKVMLDGNAKRDFLNHQLGKAVDKAHMFSLQVRISSTPDQEFAWEIAKLLLSRPDSPFFNLIRMDSRPGSGLPVTTLCAKGSSDLSTSLVGLAKLCLAAKRPVEFGANCVIDAVKIVREGVPSAFEPGRVLTPPPQETRGSASMLIGLGICLAHWLISKDEIIAGDEVTSKLVKAVEMSLDKELNDDVKLSAQGKRGLLNEFCSYFFDRQPDCRLGVPEALMTTLSASAYGVSKKKS